MPSKTERQRKAAGAALAIKRGKGKGKKGGAARGMAQSMTEKQLREFAKGKKKK